MEEVYQKEIHVGVAYLMPKMGPNVGFTKDQGEYGCR